MTLKEELYKRLTVKGGVGSGNFGHAGRIGKVGGSSSRGGVSLGKHPDLDFTHQRNFLGSEDLSKVVVEPWHKRKTKKILGYIGDSNDYDVSKDKDLEERIVANIDSRIKALTGLSMKDDGYIEQVNFVDASAWEDFCVNSGAPYNAIAFCENLGFESAIFIKNTGHALDDSGHRYMPDSSGNVGLYEIMAHEIAHAIWNRYPDQATTGEGNFDYLWMIDPSFDKKTGYATSDPREGFAETFVAYLSLGGNGGKLLKREFDAIDKVIYPFGKTTTKGSKKSGNWGHAGRPGKVGGSAPTSQMSLGVINEDDINNFPWMNQPDPSIHGKAREDGSIAQKMNGYGKFYLDANIYSNNSLAHWLKTRIGKFVTISGLDKKNGEIYFTDVKTEETILLKLQNNDSEYFIHWIEQTNKGKGGNLGARVVMGIKDLCDFTLFELSFINANPKFWEKMKFLDSLGVTGKYNPPHPKSETTKGGAGSGNFGHAGRPGKVGGSSPSSFQSGVAGTDFFAVDTMYTPPVQNPPESEYAGSLFDLSEYTIHIDRYDAGGEMATIAHYMCGKDLITGYRIEEKRFEIQESTAEADSDGWAEPNGVVYAEYNIVDKDGKNIGQFEFKYEQELGSAYLALLELDGSAQGTGFATRFVEHFEDTLRDFGCYSIELEANLNVGGYTWARLGYTFAGNGYLSYFKDEAAKQWKEITLRKMPQKIYDAIEYSWDIASLSCNKKYAKYKGQEKIGKNLLLGSRWQGIKYLDDYDDNGDGYSIGKEYYDSQRQKYLSMLNREKAE